MQPPISSVDEQKLPSADPIAIQPTALHPEAIDAEGAPLREMSFARLISTCISARLLVDIGVQMFNPFLPIFAVGLGTDVVTLGQMVSVRSSMGLFAPAIGTLADRAGYRRVLRLALVMSAIGMLTIGASNSIAMALVGMVLIGLGLAGFVPTLQAYLSARLPYAQRARGMGMLEYSWALTGIIGLSLMGLLIDTTGWRTPFFLLGGGMMVASLVFGTLPTVTMPLRTRDEKSPFSAWGRIRDFFIIGDQADSAYATIVASAANYYAAMQFMIVHGAWFVREYGLDARELGLVALLFGCFDLVASVMVSLFTDRFGKWRSVVVGTAGALGGYLLIPWLNIGIWPAVLSAALARGFFEFAIVAHFPLLSGQTTRQHRAKVMTFSSAVALGVATVAASVAPALYTRVGIGGVAMISAACAALALVVLLTRVREQAEQTDD